MELSVGQITKGKNVLPAIIVETPAPYRLIVSYFLLFSLLASISFQYLEEFTSMPWKLRPDRGGDCTDGFFGGSPLRFSLYSSRLSPYLYAI